MVKILRHGGEHGLVTPAFDVSRSSGLLGIVAGLTALCGWSVLPLYVIRHLWLISQIHPNAALGFILVGFSLRLARYDGATAWVHGACKLFRISVGLLGLLSLANIWFHWNWGIDKFVVRDATAGMPGPMPPAAALCFYLLGCALVLLTAGRSLLCQILSLTVATITTATLVASAYAWFAPQTLPGYLGMPAVTALVLLILSLGVVSSNAHYALLTAMTSNSVGGAMARRLLPASLLIPLALGFLRLQGQDAGWFSPGAGLVLHVVATMLLLALFIWWNAAALDRIARENGRFEHAVQDTQAALLEILRHVNNAAFAHDLTGNLTFFNAAAERLFGITAAEARRRNVCTVVTPPSAASVRSILSSGLIGGACHPESVVLLTSAGEQECAVLTIPMCDRNGNPGGFFSLVSPLFTGTPSKASTLEPASDPVSA
ncbi:MAG: PAS domain-containing protein [Acidobacteriota bacterium]|nr:PAS domain-containing protein [Acidobacteriota bacterium]